MKTMISNIFGAFISPLNLFRKKEEISTGCGYSGYEFGASYNDSICLEGYLWDLDSCDIPGGPLYDGG